MRTLVATTALLYAVATTPADAQVLQLPTLRVFSVSTTVVVPDRGSTYLGGVSRSGMQQRSLGLPVAGRVPGLGPLTRSRSSSRLSASSAAFVTAKVIDHSELDRIVLSRARRNLADKESLSQTERTAAFLTQHVARRRAPDAVKEPVSDLRTTLRKSQMDRQTMSDTEARELVGRGQLLEKQGRAAIAMICYRTAARQARGKLSRIAAERMRELKAKQP